MNILIVGSGAREHAIARALHASSEHPTLFCCGTSNNPGIQQYTEQYWVGNICSIEELVTLTKDWRIDMAIIGPEAPLDKGLADALLERNIAVIGPRQKLARIETSKSFARTLMDKYQIPGSPDYRVFDQLFGVKEYLQELGEMGYVIKADGLMSGKGVKVAGDHLHSLQDAFQYCEELIDANQIFVIEEKLIGQEFSLLCFCDGEHLIPMPIVQDHKRAFVNDEGPNTGGMGSYSDTDHRLPFLTDADIQIALDMNEAVIKALTAETGQKYVGILYGSFIATKNGVKLIEYNARFGDPEAMNVLAILESDFLSVCKMMIAGTLSSEKVSFANLATVCKYAVPQGYPDKPVKNALIDISQVLHPERIYFAAVDERYGKLYATGSRAIAVLGIASNIFEAEQFAEEEINRITGPLFHRKDIGTRELIDRRIRQMVLLRKVEYEI